ncbi:peptidoglycan D,D-transpeptidase FtsI family protein [Oceanobacillus damuensis]|uniref:peptidoglycan D,D-transpeptidase FtsI family protein n=1 Tax=Oceanobacillus damuensis TaxID=937928 RepID=UPI000832F9FD|nr:penicillin-binding protein 2 [Oceanobacillus damuensis]
MKREKEKKKRAKLPFRVNLLFFIVFLLFSMLILQLGIVQILKGEDFQEEIERTNLDTTKIAVPRGEIYDVNGNPIVVNRPVYSITYTPPKGVQADDKLETAENLAVYISMDDKEILEGITERNKKEYWYLKNREKADKRLTSREKEGLSNAEIYNATLDKITEQEISGFSNQELEVIAIKKELDKGYSLTPQIVKNENVSMEEYAGIAENLNELSGINATTDWNREYPYDSTLSSMLGTITSQEEGIPAEAKETFVSKGYSLNDRVGKSGLETQYEDLLRGRKEQIQYTTKKDGTVIDFETVVEGKRGKDLVLTIDMEFQQEVDKIVLEELQAAKSQYPYDNQYLTDALAVVMDPKTGELLAVSASHYNKDKQEYEDAGFKALSNAHTPGSVVKGATVLAGLDSGVISPREVIYDRPINIASTPIMRSYSNNIGAVDDIAALKRSSNVYMYYISLRLMGEYRYPFPDGESVQRDNPNAFQDLRNYFNQFGLGVSTGIDFPSESTGYQGDGNKAGDMMNHGIGQFDQYTTLQLAQYASTIGNGGYRVRPHFVKQIHEPIASQNQLGPVYKSINTEVLNKIVMSEDHIDRVQEGFRQVYQESGGTAYKYFNDVNYDPAGKTGTAEIDYFEDSEKKAETVNHNLIGYAPDNDPEIAFAIVVPYTGLNNDHPTHHNIGRRILDTYFGLKEERDEESEDGEGENEDRSGDEE